MPNIEEALAGLFGDVHAFDAELCKICGSPCKDVEIKETIAIKGGDSVSVRIPVSSCQNCDFTVADERAEEIRDAAVRLCLGLLSASEIRAIRDGLHMSQREFADAFGVTEASLDRWENGRAMQSKSSDTLLRALSIKSVAISLDRRRLIMGNKIKFADNVVMFPVLRKNAAELSDAQRRSSGFSLRN